MPPRPTLPPPEAQDADRAETPQWPPAPRSVIALCRVFDGNGAVPREETRQRVPVHRKAVERSDDRNADPLLQYPLQRCDVWRECSGVEIVEPDPGARANRGGRHIEARKSGERNDGLSHLPDGQL